MQVKSFLADYEGVTLRRHRDALEGFRTWYAQANISTTTRYLHPHAQRVQRSPAPAGEMVEEM